MHCFGVSGRDFLTSKREKYIIIEYDVNGMPIEKGQEEEGSKPYHGAFTGNTGL